MAIADILKGAYNYATGKGVLGNVMDYGAGALAANKAQYAEHTNAVGKNVFGTSYDVKPTVSYGAIANDADLIAVNTRKSILDANTARTAADDKELNTLNTNIAEFTKKRDDFNTQTKTYDSQQHLMKQLTGEVPLPKDKTQAQVLEEAMTAGTINQEQKSALDYFMVQNKGQAYTEGSIDKAFQARDTSVKDKFQTTSATLLETPTSFPGLASADDNSTMSQLKGLGIGAAIGGIAGAALYENPEEGMVYGLAGAGLARGVTRAVKNNLDEISKYGMKTVLGGDFAEAGAKVGFGIDDATKNKMTKLGFDTKDLKVDPVTGKVTNAAGDVNLADQMKTTEGKRNELSMEDIGLGNLVKDDAEKAKSVKTFTEELMNAEETAMNTKVNAAKTSAGGNLNTKAASDIDLTYDSGKTIKFNKEEDLTEDAIRSRINAKRVEELNAQRDTITKDATKAEPIKQKELFALDMQSQALTNDGKRNTSLLEDQAKKAHAEIFSAPKKGVAAVDEKQAQQMNLNSLKNKKESDLTGVQNIAKNMLTNPGGAGRLTGQYRNMILGGSALTGVAFTSNKRDYRRGINSNRGNRI